MGNLLFLTFLFYLNFLSISSSDLEQATRVTPMALAAVGRVARLGELYDARNDQFLHISLVNGNFSSILQSTHNKHSNIKYLKVNTLAEKLDSMDIQAGFKLSVLFGIVEVSGSGRFFRDKKQSSKSAKISVANVMTTEFEQIDIAGTDGRKLIDLNILEKIDATHVVVGIQWGGSVYVTVEDSNTQESDQQIVQGSLGGKIEFFVGSISLSGEVSINEDELAEYSKFSFELYGDILPKEMPTTLVDAIVQMKSLPKLLTEGNDGKGKAMSYSLLPIAVLRELLSIEAVVDSFLTSIDDVTINLCISLFEEIQNDEQKINDLMAYKNSYENYMDKEKVEQINMLSINHQLYQSELKRNLSQQLILFKSGSAKIGKITKILDEAYTHELSPKNIDFDKYFSIQTEFRFLKYLSKDLSVSMLEKTTSFQEYMSMNFNVNIYAFFYSVEFPYFTEEPMLTFRSILENRNIFDPNGLYVAIKIDVLRESERQIYFNFTAPSRLRMYRNGNCVIEDYSIHSNIDLPNDNELWSLQYMQTILTQLMSQTTQLKTETNELAINTTQLIYETNNIKQNPVPIGYVYVQYPKMLDPGTIWPEVKWTNITSSYAGLFFRAEGGTSACFGCAAQAGISPIIESVSSTDQSSTSSYSSVLQYQPGAWTGPWVNTGGYFGSWVKIRFHTRYNEVRPTNLSIRIWQRTE